MSISQANFQRAAQLFCQLWPSISADSACWWDLEKVESRFGGDQDGNGGEVDDEDEAGSITNPAAAPAAAADKHGNERDVEDEDEAGSMTKPAAACAAACAADDDKHGNGGDVEDEDEAGLERCLGSPNATCLADQEAFHIYDFHIAYHHSYQDYEPHQLPDCSSLR
eukprot:gene25483-11140_t